MNISNKQKINYKWRPPRSPNSLMNKSEVKVMFKEMADDWNRLAKEFKSAQ